MDTTKDLTPLTDIESRYADAKLRLEGLDVKNDDDYEQVCELAKAIAASEKELKDTDVQSRIDALKVELKPLQEQLKSVSDKLAEVKAICRGHIGAYAARRSSETLDEAQEKALAAAIALGDESYLDLVVVNGDVVPNVPGISFAKVSGFEIVDETKIPVSYRKIDEPAIRKVVQALKENHGIEGVRFVKKQQVRVAAK